MINLAKIILLSIKTISSLSNMKMKILISESYIGEPHKTLNRIVSKFLSMFKNNTKFITRIMIMNKPIIIIICITVFEKKMVFYIHPSDRAILQNLDSVLLIRTR